MTSQTQTKNTRSDTKDINDGELFSREIAAGYKPEVIASTTVILVGAGALGQFIAFCLAMIGFPNVLIIDMGSFDDMSNITRSPFWKEGWSKAQAVASGASSICTHAGKTAYRFATGMVQVLGDALFLGNKVIVFSAVDSPQGREWLMQRTRCCGVPLIEGGFRAERWNLSVFPNSSSEQPCWRCGGRGVATERIFSCDTYARKATEQGFIPATAPGAMGLASAMVEAGIALLHEDETLANTTVFTNMRTGVSQVMRRTLDPNCLLDHGILCKTAVPLMCSHEDSVATLLEEIEGIGCDPIVRLPSTFIRVGPCRDCHRPVVINRSEWALPDSVCCCGCGGTFEGTRRIPEQHGFLSRKTSGSICDIPLHEVGLGPGLHLIVDDGDRETPVVLGGGIQDLVTKVDSEPSI